MRILISILTFLCFTPALAQTFTVSGSITGENKISLSGALITIKQKGTPVQETSNTEGYFSLKGIAGPCIISITHLGFETYTDTLDIKEDTQLGLIDLLPAIEMLKEVSIVEKVLAMVQKGDTTEYNSGAFKVNPDADAADLVRKMPSIQLNGSQVSAQGEQVVKVLVDGRPFFGTDPYATLKNLPAYIIDKVQVYNEKSEQERFTGFSEGLTRKTINIVTRPGMNKSTFGNVYAGGGTDGSNEKYGAGATLNRFAGEKRITLTAQTNNINAQNFTEQSSGTGRGGAGITTTHAAGINYSDQWGTKTDITGSYAFSRSQTDLIRDIRKTYVLSADSGQVYNELNPGRADNDNHQFNIQLTYTADSLNALSWTPSGSLSLNNSNATRIGNTEAGPLLINKTNNENKIRNTTIALSNNILYSHRFRKKGRTFSLNVNTTNQSYYDTTLQLAENVYYASSLSGDTINQRSVQKQNTWNTSAVAAYTAPAGKNGMYKLQYDAVYTPANSEKNTFDYSNTDGRYTLPDSVLSNALNSVTLAHRAGGSYRVQLGNVNLSAGMNYQFTRLSNEQLFPAAGKVSYHFENLLPTASLNCKLSNTQQLQLIYNTATQSPSIRQLQNVINNNDPLHLSSGNPLLKQQYNHHVTVRYNTSSRNGKNMASAYLTGIYTQHYITNSSIVALRDTTVMQIVLPKGTQLTIPQNVDGYSALTGSISYGLPLEPIKSRLNIEVNAGLNRFPAIINDHLNYQHNKNAGLNISVNSNISEKIDFRFSSNTTVISNVNSLNSQLNNDFVNESCNATANLILGKGIVFNTTASYQVNRGLSLGFNQSYLLWNLSVGKKLFKKQRGDLRLSVFDLLNNNNNIQHVVTETYIQDTRSNILQRYYLLVFTYKIFATQND